MSGKFSGLLVISFGFGNCLLFSQTRFDVALPLTTAFGEVTAESDPLVVPPFVPPAPKERKEMPALSVEDSVECRMENQKRLRIVRAEPSQLPDLPSIRQELKRLDEPAAVAPNEVFEPPETNHKFIILGATIIDQEISHVTWPDVSGNPMEALCGFDISLLAGFPDFAQGRKTYSLMLMHGQHVTKRDGGFIAKAFPQLQVKPGEILLPAAIKEGAEVPEDLKAMASLIGLERERLVEFQQARELRQEAERRWREANPEPPRDETIWLRPHSGSRYLDESAGAAVLETTGQGGGQ